MNLTEALVEPYLKLQSPESDDGAIAGQAGDLIARVREGAESYKDKFVIVKSGEVVAAGSLIKAQGSVFYFKLVFEPPLTGDGFREAFEGLIGDGLSRLRELRATKVHVRILQDGTYATAAKTLSALGFGKVQERIEYRTPIAKLPTDEGSPFRWRSLADKSEASLRGAAALLERCGQGDPDWGPDDDSFELLKGYLSDPALRGGPECVHMGEAQGRQAAIVVAQVNPRTGWSRITYMGVVPEHRGRGLGGWTHRHGFSMMKAQGGVLYHGGTSADNLGMIRLFERHRCAESRRVEEWVL